MFTAPLPKVTIKSGRHHELSAATYCKNISIVRNMFFEEGWKVKVSNQYLVREVCTQEHVSDVF